MVDFNNEATIGTPSANVVKILLLEARANVFEALELYNKKIMDNLQANQNILKSRVATWFLEHQAYIKRTIKKEKDYQKVYDRFKKLFFSTEQMKDEELLDLIIELNELIDNLRITRIDIKTPYKREDIEEDNKQNDLN